MAKVTVAKNPAIDPTLPKVPLKLGKETHYLCFDFAAFALAEARLRQAGVTVNLLHALDLSAMNAERVVPLLFASLVKHQPTITPEEVAKLVTFKNLGAIFEAIGKAYEASLAEPEPDAKPNPIEPLPE
jgi:hypothetical protein